MRMNYPDLDAAEANWLQFDIAGNQEMGNGIYAKRLLDATNFNPTQFEFQVWEIVKGESVLRANQSTLEGALGYMKIGRVLVYKRQS